MVVPFQWKTTSPLLWAVQKLWLNSWDNFLLFFLVVMLNPILTGGSIWPPCTKSATASWPPQIATHLFINFSFKSYASFDTQVVKIGPLVARSCDVLYSHVGTKFAQNPHFAYVCVQNTWKLLIFLKCTITVFILSLGPFAQFLIS